MNKFGAKCEIVNGITFASKAEARRYQELCLMQAAGMIGSVTLQPKFDLVAGLKYTADFQYTTPESECVVEEVKGFEDKSFRMRLKLFHYCYPHTKLLINGVDSRAKKPRKKREKA